MLKWKLQYFGHLMQRADSLEKTLMLGKIEGRRRRGQQRMRWLDGLTESVDMSLSRLWEIVEDRKPGVLQSMGLQRVRHNLATEQEQRYQIEPQHFFAIWMNYLIFFFIFNTEIFHLANSSLQLVRKIISKMLNRKEFNESWVKI